MTFFLGRNDYKEEAPATRTDMTEGTIGCGTPKLITLRKITDVMTEVPLEHPN